MATTYYKDIQKLYVAYFNRPADTDGLAYWETVVEAAKGSTTAVAAAFAAEAEYKKAYADMTNAQIVDKVYQNLFGRPAEKAGLDYWTDLLDKKAITIDKVVTQIAGGAQGSDLTAYNNKVTAAFTFTNTLEAGNNYKGDAANVEAKKFMSGITTDASLTAAIAPATLGATIAKVIAAGTKFDLLSGLKALDVANKAKADFLAAASSDPKVPTTDTAINTKVDTAATGVHTKITTGNYNAATAGGKAALLTAQQTLNAANLADAQTALSTANANVAKIAGLTTALSTLDAATTTAKNAATASTNAHADQAAKIASYNVVNSTATITVDVDTGTAKVGTKDVIVVDATTKALVLASGIKESDYPGVTALLNSTIAMQASDKALVDANKAKADAQKAVDILDLTQAAVDALKAMTFTQVKVEAGATPTVAQMITELASLDAIAKSTKAIADAAGSTQAQKDAAIAAKAAFDLFDGKVTDFYAKDNANPLVAAQTAAKTGVTNAQKAIDDLAKAVKDLDAALATKAQLDAVNGQVDAAQTAFIKHDLMLPVTPVGTTVATAASDIFVFDAKKLDATIINFGLLGSDSLYIGSKYKLNTGDYLKGAGDNSVLEVFIVKSGNDTKIVLETSVFGSNAATPEVVTITLTGVDSSLVHLSGGLITVG